jgi:hypothetical protein
MFLQSAGGKDEDHSPNCRRSSPAFPSRCLFGGVTCHEKKAAEDDQDKNNKYHGEWLGAPHPERSFPLISAET